MDEKRASDVCRALIPLYELEEMRVVFDEACKLLSAEFIYLLLKSYLEKRLCNNINKEEM